MPSEKTTEILKQLENGVKDVFNSERYLKYLKFMSSFYNYSFRNVLLILMQNPNATMVAGYNDWKNKHNRQVLKGEKGLRILAPVPYKVKVEKPIFDEHGNPVIIDGKQITEEVTVNKLNFKPASVFDVSQTEGEPIPQLAPELNFQVKNYPELFSAISAVSEYPITFEDIPGTAHGYCDFSNTKIVIDNGMSEAQNIKTAIHEVAHSRLHSPENNNNQRTKRTVAEVEAESVAYVVSNYFGIDTSDYSFDYIANWSSDYELKELSESLDRIQKEANIMIQGIEEQYKTLIQNRDMEINNAEKGVDRDMDGIEDNKDSGYSDSNLEPDIKQTNATLESIENLVVEHKEKITHSDNVHNTVVINAFAGPGAGKTTSCLEVCEKLKKAGYVAEYVQEYAKELVWDNNLELLNGSIENQFTILQEQLRRVDRLYGKVDFVVIDSPILLNTEYLKESSPEYSSAVQELYSHFDNFNYFVERDVSKFETEGRIHNLEQSLEIDTNLKHTLQSMNIEFGTYTHSTIDNIVQNAIDYKLRSEHSLENRKAKETRSKQRRSSHTEPKKYSKEENDRIITEIKQSIPIQDYAQSIGFTVQRAGSYYTLKEHDSVRIDPRKNAFYRNSMGRKARGSIIDFVMHFEGLDKATAINKLASYIGADTKAFIHSELPKLQVSPSRDEEPKELILPKKADTLRNVYAYLINTRKINSEIVKQWVKAGNLYQDTHKNCVFVTHDKSGKPNFVSQKGTNTSKPFQADVEGSDYNCCHFINNNAKTLVVCEAVIDLMSVQTILKANGRDLNNYNYLSLNGSTKTFAILNALQSNNTDTVVIATDNDKAGEIARSELKELASKHDKNIRFIDYIPKNEKDWNAELVANVQREAAALSDSKQKLSDKISDCQNKANNQNKSLEHNKQQAISQKRNTPDIS